MANEVFAIKTKRGGKTVTLEIPREELISLEVELDTELASMFRLHLAIRRQDGIWTYLDDERFSIWQPMTIQAGFEDGMEDLIAGYITHVRPDFDPDLSRCGLEIWGIDNTALMDREEKLHAWPNEKDSSIATQIFGLYGFSSVVDDTQVVHDEAVSTIIQRETDIQFLKRLALRNGFECYVEGTTGFFRKPRSRPPHTQSLRYIMARDHRQSRDFRGQCPHPGQCDDVSSGPRLKRRAGGRGHREPTGGSGGH